LSNLTLYYFTDPTCQFCYYHNDVLKKFTAEYGSNFKTRYYMGGLIEDINKYYEESDFVKNNDDIAARLLENAQNFKMPMNVFGWKKNPIKTSHTACIYFKSAYHINEETGIKFLRRLQEEFFLGGKKIDDIDFLKSLVDEVCMEKATDVFASIENGFAETYFKQDLLISDNFEVEIYPTAIITDKKKMIKISENYEFSALLDALKTFILNPVKTDLKFDVEEFLSDNKKFTRNRLITIYDLAEEDADDIIDLLLVDGRIKECKIDYSEYYSVC